MGKFLLCVESNLRDVNSLLQFHNVHPQVRTDVQRRFQLLLHRVHDYFSTLKPGYSESPRDVCTAIVREVVNDTIRCVIPGLELAAEERRSAELEQRVCDLEARLRESERRYRKLEASLKSVREAHEIMLHHYFREVLLLRYRLHDMAMLRKRFSKSPQCALYALQVLKSPEEYMKVLQLVETEELQETTNVATMEALQNESATFFADSSPVYFTDCTGMSSTTVNEPPRCTYPTPFSHDTGSVFGENNEGDTDDAIKMAIFDGEKKEPEVIEENVFFSESPLKEARATLVEPAAVGFVTDDLLSLGLKRPKSILTSVVNSEAPLLLPAVTKTVLPAVRERPNMPSSKTASVKSLKAVIKKCDVKIASTQTTRCFADESVDAIFDYEQYIRTLNSLGDGKFGDKSDQSFMSEDLKPTSGRIWKELLKGPVFAHDYNLSHHDGTISVLRKSTDDLSHTNLFLSQTLTAVKPLKNSLLEDLNKIYEGVRQLQMQRVEDMRTLQSALEFLQARVDVVVDFIGAYAAEVDRLSDAAMRDNYTNKNQDVFVNNSKGNPFGSRVVSDYFITKPTFLPVPQKDLEEQERDKLKNEIQRCQEACNFWDSNETTLHARRAFSRLQNALSRLQKQNVFLSRHLKRYMPDVFGAITDDLQGLSDGNDLFSNTEEGKRMCNLFSEEDKLRTLVQLRMKRIAHRARYNNCLRRLREGASKGGRCEGLQTILSAALLEQNTIDKLTCLINKLLRELHFSEADAEGERLFFMKNLALSPYLNDPLAGDENEGGMHREEEEDVVYVPLPVSAEHAGDLCATLASRQSGYILFNDEIIPIASTARSQRDRCYFSLSSHVRAEGNRCRNVPFHGTVIDYTCGVQLGRPLGDSHRPVYVFWDMERGSFYVVDEVSKEERDARQRLAHQQQEQLQVQRSVRLATVLLEPNFPEAAAAYSPARQRPPVVVASSSPLRPRRLQLPDVSITAKQPLSSRTLVEGGETRFAVPPLQHGLQPYNKSTPVATGLVRPLVVQPNTGEGELMSIKALGVRQSAGGVAVSTSAMPQPGGVVTALARLKEEERQRARTKTSTAQSTCEKQAARKTANSRFLRLDFSYAFLPRPPAPE